MSIELDLGILNPKVFHLIWQMIPTGLILVESNWCFHWSNKSTRAIFQKRRTKNRLEKSDVSPFSHILS